MFLERKTIPIDSYVEIIKLLDAVSSAEFQLWVLYDALLVQSVLPSILSHNIILAMLLFVPTLIRS